MPDLNRMGLSRTGGPVGSYSPAATGAFATILDTFNRANEGPPPSASWGGVVVSGQGGIKVVSNQVVADAGGDGTGYWGTSFNANQEAFIKMASVDSTSVVLLFARIQGPGTATPDGYFVRYQGNSGGVE